VTAAAVSSERMRAAAVYGQWVDRSIFVMIARHNAEMECRRGEMHVG
jgi:hypothetical protein